VNRIDRLYALVEELRAVSPRPLSARRLAERFEVSTRTIERDLSARRSYVGQRTGRFRWQTGDGHPIKGGVIDTGGNLLVALMTTPTGLTFAHLIDPHGNHIGVYTPHEGAEL
jgi:hypothetical protein